MRWVTALVWALSSIYISMEALHLNTSNHLG